MSNWRFPPLRPNNATPPTNSSQPTTGNEQQRKRKPPSPSTDILLLQSSHKRHRNYLINDPVAISLFSELDLNQNFLNSGNVLAWALPPDDPDFLRIHQYVERTQGWKSGIKLLCILRVLPHARSLENPTTTLEFKDELGTTGEWRMRMMLWHGTKKGYLQSILENGLKLPRPNTFGFFGQGIYFADRVWKSALYTDYGNGQVIGKQGYLLLCEVLLGNIFKSEKNLPHLVAVPQPQYYQSVQGLGHWYPDPDCNKNVEGCIWPMGNLAVIIDRAIV